MRERAARVEALLPRLLRRMFNEPDEQELADLTLAQLRILRAVLDSPHTAGEIVELLGYSRSALSQLTQRLVSAGLLIKHKDAHDARIKHLELTEKGRTLMQRRRDLRIDQAEMVLARLDDSEQAELVRILEKMSRTAGTESWTSSIERLTA